MKKPELLAPAGSPESLKAAISAGADAVYMGLSKFNARQNADNFGREELVEAVRLCKFYNKKLYITLNTLVFDREISEVLGEARFCAEAGVDAFIVQDLGLIRLLREILPEVPIHASTQCATHSLEQVKALAELGVERVVVARELSKYDLEAIMRETPVEIEAFVHGALCMSHSGTCLMSAYMGGRSGNRGECAQPCRLPYNESYPLSLRDLSLANHVRELCEMGIDSFKLEGRMKSAEYVYRTVKVWRRLVDENRDATLKEIQELEDIFSRGGFTDGYYTLEKGNNMLGTRSEKDKEKTREAEKITEFSLPKREITAEFVKNGDRAGLTLACDGISAFAECEALEPTGNGTGEEVIRDSLLKLGDTNFTCSDIKISLDSPVFFRRSTLNAVRREACEALEEKMIGAGRVIPERAYRRPCEKTVENGGLWVVYQGNRQVDGGELEALFERGVERVFLPYSTELERPDERCGILLPRAVFDKDLKSFEDGLLRLKRLGYTSALAENLGVAMTARRFGFELYGGAGLNAVNSFTLGVLDSLGFRAVALSGEVTDAYKRGLAGSVPVGETVWGRASLMLIENCVMGARDGCFGCTGTCRKRGELVDRTGERFPVIPDAFHRSVIYNSRPTYNADKPITDGISFRVIYITDERSALSVVDTVTDGNAPDFKFTRK